MPSSKASTTESKALPDDVKEFQYGFPSLFGKMCDYFRNVGVWVVRQRMYLNMSIYIYIHQSLWAVLCRILLHQPVPSIAATEIIWIKLRFLVKLEGNGVHARKFKYADFPTDTSCQKAAVAYAKKVFTLLTTFETLRGKATDVGTVVFCSSFFVT